MKKKKTYAAVMLVAGLLSLLGCVPAFADAEGFSEEYSRFQDPVSYTHLTLPTIA